MIIQQNRDLAWWVALLLAGSVTGCVVGPQSIVAGRGVYNEVINRTEDQQLLNVIVRQRYNESFGMLGVASVTANIRARADVRAQFGLTRSLKEDYDGNLVPLDVGVAFEENPTISYVPFAGEAFMQRLLSPLTMNETLLMMQFGRAWDRSYLDIGIRSVNGIRNRRYGKVDTNPDCFDRASELLRTLTSEGATNIACAADGSIKFIFQVSDAEEEQLLKEWLELLRIDARPSEGRLEIPVQVAAGLPSSEKVVLETASVIAIIRAAGECIDIPESHLQAGFVEPAARDEMHPFIRIRTSRKRPPGQGTVAIRYRDWWYYVDDADPESKQAFLFLRTLLGLRLQQGAKDEGVPVLTIPVGG